MNIKDMECFIKVFEYKSFSKVAEMLFLTPQGVSKTVKRLENEYGVEFFTRSLSDGLHETEYGSYFYLKACEFVSLYHDTQAGIESIKLQTKGILRLHSAFGILRLLTPDFVIGFSNKYPDIYISQNVLEGNCDLGFAPYLREEAGVHIQHLFSRELYFITHRGSKYYDYNEISLEEIVTEPIIIENKNFCIHKIFEEALEERGVKCRFYFETSGFSMCYKLCKQQKGNTVSMDFIFDDMGNTDLKKIPFKEHIMWNVGIMYKDNVPVSSLDNKLISYANKWCEVETEKIEE
ncbi:MAG: LysR family transcriptional regulator [Hespellia sp.]|nr:LysR family transcriptional regulator [Hespellia sp.]